MSEVDKLLERQSDEVMLALEDFFDKLNQLKNDLRIDEKFIMYV